MPEVCCPYCDARLEIPRLGSSVYCDNCRRSFYSSEAQAPHLSRGAAIPEGIVAPAGREAGARYDEEEDAEDDYEPQRRARRPGRLPASRRRPLARPASSGGLTIVLAILGGLLFLGGAIWLMLYMARPG